jgi:glutathione synthase/RimK-type ligase-like ATP-grasp enzyme
MRDAQDKLRFFGTMTENLDAPRIPWFHTDKNAAIEYGKKRPIVARKVLTGHSGAGIVYCEVGGELPNAPLYVEYVKKKDEYRVHYIRTPIGMAKPDAQFATFVQRKVRVRDNADPNWTVRNLAGGFAYANDPSNVGDVPSDVLEQSRKAFVASGLDFGAVDVIWNDKQGQAYVLEINTAPGLQGRTVQFYADNLRKLVA